MAKETNMILELSLGVIETIFSTFYTNSHVEFIRRKTNKVAQSLAKTTTSLISFQLFIDMPTCIQTIVVDKIR